VISLDAAIALAKSRSDCHPANIDTLVQLVNELHEVPGCIVECGSYKCGATIAMAASDPSKTVYAFDLFGGLPYGDGIGFENFGKNDFNEVKTITAPFKNIVLVRGLHEETVPKFLSRPVSLLFMDSDFYSSHQVALSRFWPILSPTGVVMFHDWTFPEVQRAIREIIPVSEQSERGQLADSPTMGMIRKCK